MAAMAPLRSQSTHAATTLLTKLQQEHDTLEKQINVKPPLSIRIESTRRFLERQRRRKEQAEEA
eukprot:1713515-Prorocentrum_lima.AAC.1